MRRLIQQASHPNALFERQLVMLGPIESCYPVKEVHLRFVLLSVHVLFADS